jgi:hypothetical protein
MVFGGRETPPNGKLYSLVFIMQQKIFSRNSRPISIKLGANQFWIKGILKCTKKM